MIAAWVLLLTIGFNVLLANRLRHQADDLLRARAEAAATTVQINDDGHVSVREPANDAALDAGIWIYAGTTALDRPRGGEIIQAAADALAGSGPRFTDDNGDLKLFALPIRYHGVQVATVVASTAITPYRHAAQAALVGSVLVAVLALIGAYPVLRFAAARALRPVDRMTRQAAEWSAHAITERFGPGQRFAELQTLANSLDDVLDHLAAVVRHERQLSAELSHELRTPLSRIVAETDLLRARPHTADEVDAAHLAIHDTALAMDRIIETLLSTARAEIRETPGLCELSPTIARAVADSSGADEGPLVVVDVGAANAGIDAAVLERILSPVIDNARRHAVTEVTITTRRSSESVVIDITDDGPGVPEQLRDDVFEPGFRADPDDDRLGAGLGLALARRLARAADGDVTITGHGSTFSVRLPPA